MILNQASEAIYFSRRTIPCVRDALSLPATDQLKAFPFLKHLGIYGYRRETLLKLVQWPVSTQEEGRETRTTEGAGPWCSHSRLNRRIREHWGGYSRGLGEGSQGTRNRENNKMKETKYIFVTGGVVSSLGKGLTAASLGTLLESRGLKVAFKNLILI